MPDVNAIAEAMFGAAAGVLGSLVDRPVTASPAEMSESDASLKVERETVATLTTVGSSGVSFVTIYHVADFGKVIGVMLGSPIEGEMDAMQMSIVSETVQQISQSMGEHLAQETGADSSTVKCEVVTEAAAFPAPPFDCYISDLDVGGEFQVEMTIEFDPVALAKLANGVAEESGAEPAAAVDADEPAPAPAAAPPPAPAAAAPPPPPAAAAPPEPSAPAKPSRPVPTPQPVGFTQMNPTPRHGTGHANLDLVHDVPLQISAVLGRTALSLRDVVSLQTGSVFELDKLSTEPIDLYVNNILIARGEVVVVDDKFAVKISELNPSTEKV